MTFNNKIKPSKFFSLPPPSTVILSNLANQLILDKHFYLAVLECAKKFGHSAVYQRKVIVNPCNIVIADKSGQSNDCESLAGEFLWVPYCGDEIIDSESYSNVCKEHSVQQQTWKKIWTESRKAAYLRSKKEVHKNICLDKSKFGCPKRLVKINITKSKIKSTDSESIVLPIYNQEDAKSKDVVTAFNRRNVVQEDTLIDSQSSLELCRIKTTDYELFPVFKNYREGLPTNKLYVKNLSKNVKEHDLHNLFSKFVIPCNLKCKSFDIRFFEHGKLRRQAFITYPNTHIATNACRSTNGIMLKGKPLIVVFANGGIKSKK